MTFVDEHVRVEVNTHGGVVLHFAVSERHPAFTVWNTAGGQWAINKAIPTPDPNGLWGNGYADVYNHLADACWLQMNKTEDGLVYRAEAATP